MTAQSSENPLAAIEFGTGCWQWGDRMMWGYGGGYAIQDVREAFEASLKAGVTFFDTAEAYGMGRSETLLGRFARESGRPILTATKFFPMPWRLRRAALLRALRGSLRRLGMERVDLYQVHWPYGPGAVTTWMDGMADAVEAGLVRAVGISNYDVEQTRQAYLRLRERGVRLASNQVHYSLLDRRVERSGLVALCQELGVRVIAYSPLEKGLLTGKYTPENPPPGLRSRTYRPEYLGRIQPLIEALRRIGARHANRTPGQVALNWLICRGALPIPGAKNRGQLEQNAGALGWRLSETEVAELGQLRDGLGRG